MKISEFRKLIREEVRKVIKEASDVANVVEKAAPKKKRYYPKKKAAPKAEPKAAAKK